MFTTSGTAITVGVKSHVLYSRLLTAEDYWYLLSFKTTTEIAEFLKAQEGYRLRLSTLPRTKVNRINLENAVRSEIFEEASSFFKYLSGIRREVFVDWLGWYEAEQLKNIFRWIRSRRLERSEIRARTFDIPGSNLPYDNLLNCRNYEEALDLLNNTKYYNVLKEPVKRLHKGETSLFALETAIDYLNESELDKDLHLLPKAEKKFLLPMFKSRIDLYNLYYLHRCIRYYNMTTEEALSRMPPIKYTVKMEHLREIAKAGEWDARLDVMEKYFPAYAKLFRDAWEKENKELALEASIKRDNYNQALDIFKKETPGYYTALCYFILKSHEIDDIIRMIEDVRYGYNVKFAASYLIRPIISGGERAWQS